MVESRFWYSLDQLTLAIIANPVDSAAFSDEQRMVVAAFDRFQLINRFAVTQRSKIRNSSWCINYFRYWYTELAFPVTSKDV
jgi:hypothetical protein